MPFNIDSFKSNISNYGYMRTNQFEVNVGMPNILRNSNLNYLGTSTSTRRVTDRLTQRIEQVRIPGIGIVTADTNRYGVGVTSKTPINARFDDTSISMLLDGYGDIWNFWYNWTKSVFEYTGTESSLTGQANRIPLYASSYKEDFSTTIEIVVYDTFGNVNQRIHLHKAFPTSIKELPLAWGEQNNLLRMSVSLSYSDYSIVGTALENNNIPSTGIGSTLSNTKTF